MLTVHSFGGKELRDFLLSEFYFLLIQEAKSSDGNEEANALKQLKTKAKQSRNVLTPCAFPSLILPNRYVFPF